MNNHKQQPKTKNKPKTIGIDGRCLLDTNYTGVSEYTVTLIKKLLKEHPHNRYIIFLNSFKGRDIQKKLLWLRRYSNVSLKHFYWPNKLLNFSLWFFRWPKLDKLIGGTDIFIAPNISFLGVSKQTKFILTIHDLSFERFKKTFSWKRRLWHFIINPRQLSGQANEIWTVSNSTKWDLESLYKISDKKIKVKPIIQNLQIFKKKSISKRRITTIKKRYQLPEKFILYLGTIEPRKNIIKLVQAFEYLRKNKLINSDYKLVLAGQFGWKYGKILKYIDNSPYRTEIILPQFVKPEDKPYFYHLASVFVFPSLFEGFGIPVVEAMASGTPVITSNNSSLPEVVNDAGILIDPDRTEDLIDALELLLNSKTLQKEFHDKGLERVVELERASNSIKILKS